MTARKPDDPHAVAWWLACEYWRAPASSAWRAAAVRAAENRGHDGSLPPGTTTDRASDDAEYVRIDGRVVGLIRRHPNRGYDYCFRPADPRAHWRKWLRAGWLPGRIAAIAAVANGAQDG